ncbi:MAG: MFS transporter, partial [bacterium]|nr:MFS transporter [bacterium]
FILFLHFAVIAYFTSTFLATFGISEDYVGVLYAAGSVITLFGLAFAPFLLSRIGNYASILLLAFVDLFALVGLIYVRDIAWLIPIFMLALITPPLIAYSLDIFLENEIKNEAKTGWIRGVFLTMASIAVAGGPFLGGFFAADENFARLFAMSGIIFIPFVLIVAFFLQSFRDPKYKHFHIQKVWNTLAYDKNMRGSFAVQFLLRFFYGIMVVYTPLYLHTVLHMPIQDVGIVIAIALIAFVLLEAPLGRLEDTRWGEKEALVVGFIILAVATAALSFVATASVALWAALLFLTRIGAAIVEVSSEGYFFKHVGGDDTDDVSAFRMIYPFAYVMSALFGSITLAFLPFNMLFATVALVLLLGIPATL